MAEELTKINENLSLDRKDACLIYENEDFFLVTIIILECVERVYQHPSFSDLLKFFSNTDSLISTKILLRTLRKVYDEFKITNYNLYINHYDKYRKRIDTEVETEKDPVEKAKKEEIIADFLDLDAYIWLSNTEKNRHIIDRDRFTLYAKQFRAFNYLRDDIVVFFDLIPSFFDIDDFNRKLKHIFDNLNAISASQEISSGGIVFEVWESRKILAELSWGLDSFKIPFTKVGTMRRVNLVRLMKYWELEWLVIIDDWLWDDGWWSIKLLSKSTIEPIQDFLNSIANLRTYLDENILETRMEQELLAKMRWFDYTSLSSDAIFLWKIKRVKATPQSIWSLSSTRWYSTNISEAILEWEKIFLTFNWPKMTLDEIQVNEVTEKWILPQAPQNLKNVFLEKHTWFFFLNNEKISHQTPWNQEFIFLSYLCDHSPEWKTHKDIVNFVRENTRSINEKSDPKKAIKSDASALCTTWKLRLNEDIQKYIHPVKWGLQILDFPFSKKKNGSQKKLRKK